MQSSLHFWGHPVRTVETFTGIAEAWGGHENVNWTEEPRLREQDFGNFQDPQKMGGEILKERKMFGRIWYRFPSGESGADVYDRVSIFLDSLHRTWAFHPAENFILVTHGFWMR
jgi:broad specificity phosphatase PhoE